MQDYKHLDIPFEGICQTFGPVYAYLCLQMGIGAISAGGLSTDDAAHEWTLVKLDSEPE